MSKNNKTCSSCGTSYFHTNVNSVYCKHCYNIRKNDICEVIESSGVCIIIDQNNIDVLPGLISSKEINVRLDLHGVLDTLVHDVEFENPNNIMCVSFVGSTTCTRINARVEIQRRLGHQLAFGILVFKRGKGKNMNMFRAIGSKAWINSLIPIGKNQRAIFIDDSDDHYESVKSLNLTNLDSHLFKDHDNLYEIINKYVKTTPITTTSNVINIDTTN